MLTLHPDRPLTINDVVAVARQQQKLSLSEAVRQKIQRCRQFFEKTLAAGKPIYSVNTGWGAAVDFTVAKDQMKAMQAFQIRSHAAGFGPPLPIERVRAAMLSRIATHSRGFSAGRLEVTEMLVELLNRQVTPVVPERGSVGASGDLAPMAHVGLVLMGEGEAFHDGKRLSGAAALDRAGLQPLQFDVRDGLALINGSNFICGSGALLAHDMQQLLLTAEVCAAMSMEGLLANPLALDARIHDIRGFAGAVKSAKHLRRLLKDSGLYQNSERLQDAYSIRSTPQVLGTAWDALAYIQQQCEIELNGAGDNPLFVAEDDAILTSANFQGSPVALPLDLMAPALTMVCMISERRLNRLLHPALNHDLPLFLTEKPGLFTGFMTSHYTADALLSEQRLLSAPATVLSLPASADQEDFVSMGMTSANKAWQIVANAYGVLAIEALAAAQAIDLRQHSLGKLQLGVGTAAAHKSLRALIPHLEEDRVLATDQEQLSQHLRSGEWLQAIAEAAGPFEET